METGHRTQSRGRRVPLLIPVFGLVGGVILVSIITLMMFARRAEASAGWVAYITTDYRIGVVRVDGNHRLTFNPNLESPASPLWLSDHDILFSGGLNRDYRLYVLRFPSGDVREIIQPPGGIIPLTLRRLPDTDWVYFSGFRDSPRSIELYRADLTTGQVEQVTDFATQEGGIADFDLSPDGERLVVVVNSRRPQVPNQTYVMQADGTQSRRIDGGWIIEGVRWADGGTRLIVTVYDSSGPRLFRMTPDGGNLRVFRFIPQAVTHFVIAPDEQHIVYHVACGYARYNCIDQVQTDGQAIQRLTQPDRNRLIPILSPDGAWIAYLETALRHSNVWRMRADGSDQRLLADDANHRPVAWSPPVDRAWGGAWLIGVGILLILGGFLANRRK